jgi:BolA protein
MLGTKQDFLDEITQKLNTELAPSFLDITDDSHEHADHFAGSDLHLTLTIRTAKFEGLSKVQQHQLIYKILGDYIGTNKGIHALRIITQ